MGFSCIQVGVFRRLHSDSLIESCCLTWIPLERRSIVLQSDTAGWERVHPALVRFDWRVRLPFPEPMRLPIALRALEAHSPFSEPSAPPWTVRHAPAERSRTEDTGGSARRASDRARVAGSGAAALGVGESADIYPAGDAAGDDERSRAGIGESVSDCEVCGSGAAGRFSEGALPTDRGLAGGESRGVASTTEESPHDQRAGAANHRLVAILVETGSGPSHPRTTANSGPGSGCACSRTAYSLTSAIGGVA